MNSDEWDNLNWMWRCRKAGTLEWSRYLGIKGAQRSANAFARNHLSGEDFKHVEIEVQKKGSRDILLFKVTRRIIYDYQSELI